MFKETYYDSDISYTYTFDDNINLPYSHVYKFS